MHPRRCYAAGQRAAQHLVGAQDETKNYKNN
jgi:hypothetical protein